MQKECKRFGTAAAVKEVMPKGSSSLCCLKKPTDTQAIQAELDHFTPFLAQRALPQELTPWLTRRGRKIISLLILQDPVWSSACSPQQNGEQFPSGLAGAGLSCFCMVSQGSWKKSSCLQARKLSAFFFYLLEGLELCASWGMQALWQLGVHVFSWSHWTSQLYCTDKGYIHHHICYLHLQELFCKPTHVLLLASSSGKSACLTSSFMIVQLLLFLPLPYAILLIYTLL